MTTPPPNSPSVSVSRELLEQIEAIFDDCVEELHGLALAPDLVEAGGSALSFLKLALTQPQPQPQPEAPAPAALPAEVREALLLFARNIEAHKEAEAALEVLAALEWPRKSGDDEELEAAQQRRVEALKRSIEVSQQALALDPARLRALVEAPASPTPAAPPHPLQSLTTEWRKQAAAHLAGDEIAPDCAGVAWAFNRCADELEAALSHGTSILDDILSDLPPAPGNRGAELQPGRGAGHAGSAPPG